MHIRICQQGAFAGLALDPLDKFVDRHIEPDGYRFVQNLGACGGIDKRAAAQSQPSPP